jgi:hypothetical protein
VRNIDLALWKNTDWQYLRKTYGHNRRSDKGMEIIHYLHFYEILIRCRNQRWIKCVGCSTQMRYENYVRYFSHQIWKGKIAWGNPGVNRRVTLKRILKSKVWSCGPK